VQALWPTAIAISLVGFMESIAVAKTFARQSGAQVDANIELRALGLANLGGAFFQAYPVTGGFSRTAVNAEAGARTGIATIVTATVVALALLFLTPLFYSMPTAVLAGIIMTAVLGLIDMREAKHLWLVSRADFALTGITFLATLTMGIELGIGVGVGASLLRFVVANSKPHVAVLGRLPHTTTYRNIRRHPDALCTDGIIALRIDGPLFFANTAFLSDTILGLVDDSPEPISSVVLDASSIGNADASGAAAIVDVAQSLAARGVQMWLSTVRGPVQDTLKLSGLLEVLPADQLVDRVHDAVEQAVRSRPIPFPSPSGSDPGRPGAMERSA
jgi:SulP family sulfate permease